MYFSYSFDLTNSFQRQSKADESLPLWKRVSEDSSRELLDITDGLLGRRPLLLESSPPV